LIAQDHGFSDVPDLVLIDGGVVHAKTARDAISALGIVLPVVGMVKDDRHRTRALVTPEGLEIAIDSNPAVFALIGNIQEETHRFAINYHRQLRSKRLKYSELDAIAGIGPKRKEQLLKKFKSITAISAASVYELEQILPSDAALAVFKHFHPEDEKES
jgi:excinuclease ABC subunit C